MSRSRSKYKESPFLYTKHSSLKNNLSVWYHCPKLQSFGLTVEPKQMLDWFAVCVPLWTVDIAAINRKACRFPETRRRHAWTEAAEFLTLTLKSDSLSITCRHHGQPALISSKTRLKTTSQRWPPAALTVVYIPNKMIFYQRRQKCMGQEKEAL